MQLKYFIATSMIPLSFILSPHVEAAGNAQIRVDNVQIGQDNNSFDNPVVQPQDPAQSGGGRDQSLQLGDILQGTNRDDIQIGVLGIDVLIGGRGDDVQIGGLEHFSGNNRDRALGNNGDDIFVWKPGDGSDFFDGGRGHDVVMFGVVGEPDGAGGVAFQVLNDQEAGEVYLDPATNLPIVNLTGSPGFCEVIDGTFDAEEAEQLDALDLDHLVRFIIRNEANDGADDGDNGLRVTLHLRNVETLVCTNEAGGEIEVLDLTVSPPRLIDIADVRPRKLRNRLEAMVQ